MRYDKETTVSALDDIRLMRPEYYPAFLLSLFCLLQIFCRFSGRLLFDFFFRRKPPSFAISFTFTFKCLSIYG